MPQPVWTISQEARRAYLRVLHTGRADPHADAAEIAELTRFGLIAEHPDVDPSEGMYVALNPNEAAGRRRDAMLVEIADAMAGAAALPAEVQDLFIAWRYRPHQPASTAAEHVEGLEAINARISQIVAETTTELLTAQPLGPRPSASLDMARGRDLDALGRGVSMRTLYRDIVRTDPTTSAWVRTMTAVGARIRTTPEPFLRCLIFDRRAAVLSDYTPWTSPEAEPPRALIVEHEGLVHYVAAMFDREWDRAAVWKGEQAVPPAAADDPLTPRQQQIAQHLAAGSGQAAVAHALNVSERVVQNELALMRRVLGCATNAAMMWELGRRAGRPGG